jgi:hypothetical protein
LRYKSRAITLVKEHLQGLLVLTGLLTIRRQRNQFGDGGGKHGAFTSEDDEHLIELKENQRLRWKDIAKAFPGKSANTLQVRYCTKLKNRHPGSEDSNDSEE